MDRRGIIKKPFDARTFLDGQEIVREYFKTNTLYFGVSTLKPNAVGGLDPGHVEANEVFYCIQGHVLCYFPEDDSYYELFKGDALLIPPSTGHRLFNIGDEDAVITFSCAPHP